MVESWIPVRDSDTNPFVAWDAVVRLLGFFECSLLSMLELPRVVDAWRERVRSKGRKVASEFATMPMPGSRRDHCANSDAVSKKLSCGTVNRSMYWNRMREQTQPLFVRISQWIPLESAREHRTREKRDIRCA